MNDTIDSNKNLTPWKSENNSNETAANEMYNNLIDAGTKGISYLIYRRSEF
jgi:hypothetical protein